jgi:hypothetical protein
MATAKFPTAVATDTDLKIAVNGISTVLRGNISEGDTVLAVANASGIVADTLLTIGRREIVAVTAVSGNNITVTRGFDGTTARAFSTGAEVAGYPAAWNFNQLAAEVKAIETALGPGLSNVGGAPSIAVTSRRISTDYNFTPQSPGGSLVIGANVITLTPVPDGINATNTNHYLYISGGTGTAEAVKIIGGTAAAGAASGTVIVTCANTHSGAWTIKSATAGIQEAIFAAGIFGSVFIPGGSHYLYGPINVNYSTALEGVPQVSFLRCQFPTGDVVIFEGKPNWTGFNNASAFGLVVWSDVTRTSGADFVMKWIQDGHFSHLRTANGYDGMRITGALHVQFSDIQLIDSHYAMHLYSTTSEITGGHANAFQANGLRISSAQEGIRIESNTTGCSFNGVFIENTGTSIHILKPGASAVNELAVSDGYLDGFTVAGVYLDQDVPSNGMMFSNLRINAVAGASSSYGIFATKDNYNVKLNNNIIVAHDGLWMQGAKGWTVTGNSIAPLDTGGRGLVMATNICSNNMFVGNTIGYDATYQGPTGTLCDKGIVTDTVAHSDNFFEGNRIKGLGANVDWQATGANNIFEKNVGIDDSVSTIASAASITLGVNPTVKITGTTQITTILGGWPGRQVQLLFTNASPGGVGTGGNILRTQTAGAVPAADFHIRRD